MKIKKGYLDTSHEDLNDLQLPDVLRGSDKYVFLSVLR